MYNCIRKVSCEWRLWYLDFVLKSPQLYVFRLTYCYHCVFDVMIEFCVIWMCLSVLSVHARSHLVFLRPDILVVLIIEWCIYPFLALYVLPPVLTRGYMHPSTAPFAHMAAFWIHLTGCLSLLIAVVNSSCAYDSDGRHEVDDRCDTTFESTVCIWGWLR